MQNYYDIGIGNISVIVKKKENTKFIYNCEGRLQDGFVFITNGNGVFSYQGKQIPLKKNMIISTCKGDVYSIYALDNDFEYITTAFDTLPAKAFRIIGLPIFLDLNLQHYLENQFDLLLKIWNERSSLYILKTRVQLSQIIIDLFSFINKNSNSIIGENKILPAITYIDQFYDKDISVLELANLCNFSVSHFRRIFKEKTGYSPNQYRESVRIHWAKQWLISDLFSVSEIAQKLGYYDIYHFSKDFKKNTGLSPKQYLVNYKNKE